MITVAEASNIIFNNLFSPLSEMVSLTRATGRILAEQVKADRDFPPFNRVSMDGVALRYEEWERGRRVFPIEATQAAGERQKTLTNPAGCIEVMTGAVLPAGCDIVIRYEDVEVTAEGAGIKVDVVTPWQSVHLQGIDAKKDQVILEPGLQLAPSEIALLASVGKSNVRVFSLPKVAIISTGDELVDVNELPLPWQVRRSNSYALESAFGELGGEAVRFHLDDDYPSMKKSMLRIVDDFDVLILSGGVSRGKFDFVPQVLDDIGIRKLFHQVSQRPGKPFWFGRSATGKVAFALPGNPVSTFMCFYKYIRPWMFRSMAASVPEKFAVLAKDFSFAPPLTCFLQVSVTNDAGTLLAVPVPGGGSGDFANLRNVTGFLELPLDKKDFKAGEVFPYIAFRE